MTDSPQYPHRAAAENNRHTVLEAIATANPPTRGEQRHAAQFMANIETLSDSLRSRIPAIYERSGIDYRYTCIPDYGHLEPSKFEFFPPSWSLKPSPTTQVRNRHYRTSVLPMAEDAAKQVLNEAGMAPDEITHVVAVSCTGFFAPGLDVELVKRLGLPPSTQRTLIGFMGCYAAFNAMRVADSFCRSDPRARVLVVCAELCTLHFQVEDTLESAVVNALFSDGAAAAIFSSRSREEAAGKLAYAASQALLDDDSMGDMTWEIGDAGFLMGLSSRVPGVIARHLPDYIDELSSAVGGRDKVGFWAIHPGGRAIVEKARDVLDLSPEDVEDSFETLRLHGNMSSPTILFVLKRILDRHNRERRDGEAGYQAGLAMAFGPGLTLEGAAFQAVS